MKSATRENWLKIILWIFQSTHSMKSATQFNKFWCTTIQFQSTHSMKSATGTVVVTPSLTKGISIHALHEECDPIRKSLGCIFRYFNPRTPWRVRRFDRLFRRQITYFNPRTPWRVRQSACRNSWSKRKFQSTHSMKSATQQKSRRQLFLAISIHALHEECDIVAFHLEVHSKYFNPRTPWRVRPKISWVFSLAICISIHALHEECDHLQLPYLPHWNISIHALHEECDYLTFHSHNSYSISIHALHEECDFKEW